MQLLHVYLNRFWCNSLLKCVSQPKIAKKSIKNPILASKVIEFGGNQEPVYDLLLVINSNLGPISHRYWDTVTYWLKSQIFPTTLSFSTLVQNDPLWIYGKALWFLKPVFQAAEGEDMVILSCTVFDWSTRVTDGQTKLWWLRRAESSSCFHA